MQSENSRTVRAVLDFQHPLLPFQVFLVQQGRGDGAGFDEVARLAGVVVVGALLVGQLVLGDELAFQFQEVVHGGAVRVFDEEDAAGYGVAVVVQTEVEPFEQVGKVVHGQLQVDGEQGQLGRLAFVEEDIGIWWLAKTCLFLVTQPLTNQLLTKFCSVRQIPEGTKTGQNHRKIKSRTPCSEYPHLNICYSGAKVQICPVKNESKRIKFTSIVHFLFSCTTMDNTNRFLPRLDGLAPKSRVKICFVASGSHVRRKCVGLYRHSARSFAGKRKPCIFKYRKLDETDTEKVSDRPTDNLPADGRKSRQMGKLNIYKSIISR